MAFYPCMEHGHDFVFLESIIHADSGRGVFMAEKELDKSIRVFVLHQPFCSGMA